MYKVAVFFDDLVRRQKIVSALAELGCTLQIPKRSDDWLEFVCSGRPQFALIGTDYTAVSVKDFTATLRSHEGLSELRVILVADQDSARQIEADWGVTDVILPPYDPAEIALRMKLAMWRDGQPSADDILAAGRININLANYEVTVDGAPVEMTFKEYELLKYLVSHPGRVHTRDALLSHVWGYDYFGGTRTVDVHVRRLREKLGLEAAEHIETVRNVGYRFKA